MRRQVAGSIAAGFLGLLCVGCGTTPTPVAEGTVVLTTVMSVATTVTVTESGAAVTETGAQITVTETEVVTKTESAAPETTATETTATSAGSDTAKFGGDGFTWSDGLSVKVSKPAAFTPSDTAAGSDQFKNFVVMTVTLKNGSKAKYDPSLFYMTVSSGDQEADQVFDSANGISGSPSTSVLPGRSVTFKQAFGVKDPKDIIAEVSPGFDYDAAIFTT